MADEYLDLGRQSLKLFDLEYHDSYTLEDIVIILRKVSLYPTSETQIEISNLILDFTRELSNNGDISKLRNILKDLENRCFYDKYFE